MAEQSQLQEELASQRVILIDLEKQLSEAQGRVSDLTQLLNNQRAKLGVLQEYLTRLNRAPELQKIAQTALEDIKQIVDAKTEELSEATEKLALLKVERNAKVKIFEDLQARYLEQKEAERRANLVDQYEAIKQAGHNPIPIVDETGRVTGYIADTPKAHSVAVKPATQATVPPTQKASLPKTGESVSLVSILLSVVFAGLAAVTGKSRKEY